MWFIGTIAMLDKICAQSSVIHCRTVKAVCLHWKPSVLTVKMWEQLKQLSCNASTDGNLPLLTVEATTDSGSQVC